MSSENLRYEAITRLRQAVAMDAYEDVQAALAEYRQHIDQALAALPPDAAPPVELAREAGELMQWALQVARSTRARTRDQLDQISAVLGYRGPRPQISTWKMDG
jgi:ABC-type transporter Mla subunit MlaD